MRKSQISSKCDITSKFPMAFKCKIASKSVTLKCSLSGCCIDPLLERGIVDKINDHNLFSRSHIHFELLTSIAFSGQVDNFFCFVSNEMGPGLTTQT